MGVGSVEGCDDQESVCSSNEREGDAFPKAFDRELVTPTNLQKTHGDSVENAATDVVNKSIDSDTKETNKSNTEIIEEKTEITAKPIEEIASTEIKSDAENSQLGKEFKEMRTIEERRRSLLDHHWAVPSKERYFLRKKIKLFFWIGILMLIFH